MPLWGMTPCRLVVAYQTFEGLCTSVFKRKIFKPGHRMSYLQRRRNILPGNFVPMYDMTDTVSHCTRH